MKIYQQRKLQKIWQIQVYNLCFISLYINKRIDKKTEEKYTKEIVIAKDKNYKV